VKEEKGMKCTDMRWSDWADDTRMFTSSGFPHNLCWWKLDSGTTIPGARLSAPLGFVGAYIYIAVNQVHLLDVTNMPKSNTAEWWQNKIKCINSNIFSGNWEYWSSEQRFLMYFQTKWRHT
jgi:hypothetical protein